MITHNLTQRSLYYLETFNSLGHIRIRCAGGLPADWTVSGNGAPTALPQPECWTAGQWAPAAGPRATRDNIYYRQKYPHVHFFQARFLIEKTKICCEFSRIIFCFFFRSKTLPRKIERLLIFYSNCHNVTQISAANH